MFLYLLTVIVRDTCAMYQPRIFETIRPLTIRLADAGKGGWNQEHKLGCIVSLAQGSHACTSMGWSDKDPRSEDPRQVTGNVLVKTYSRKESGSVTHPLLLCYTVLYVACQEQYEIQGDF